MNYPLGLLNLSLLIVHILAESAPDVLPCSLTTEGRECTQRSLKLRPVIHRIRDLGTLSLGAWVTARDGRGTLNIVTLDLGLLLPVPRHRDAKLDLRNQSGRPRIRELSDKSTPRHREGAKADGETPFLAVERVNLESVAANEDDQDLPANHDAVDGEEEPVLCDALEDIEPVIKTTVVELVEYLQPNKRVEDQSVQ